MREWYSKGEALPLACVLSRKLAQATERLSLGTRSLYFLLVHVQRNALGSRLKVDSCSAEGRTCRTNEPIRNKEYLGTCFNFFCVCGSHIIKT